MVCKHELIVKVEIKFIVAFKPSPKRRMAVIMCVMGSNNQLRLVSNIFGPSKPPGEAKLKEHRISSKITFAKLEDIFTPSNK